MFALVGAALKRPAAGRAGLRVRLGDRGDGLPGYLKRFTVAYLPAGPGAARDAERLAVSLMQAMFRETPSLTESLIWLAVIEVGLPLAGGRAVTRREYVLEQ